MLSTQTIEVKRLYTLREAAVYLGLTQWAIRSLIWRGVLPHVNAAGRYLIDRVAMDAWIERSQTTSEIYQVGRLGSGK